MKKFFLLAAVCAATLSASATDFYVIGDNVNGAKWALATEDALMTDKGDGIYEWEGTELGTGFKINDGTWNNSDLGDGLIANFGSNGDVIASGEPYYFETGGSTGDINFADGKTLCKNPKIVLNMNDQTITLTGEFEGSVAWYICGTFNTWAMGAEEALMEEVDGKLVKKGLVIPAPDPESEEVPGFKVASTGWATAYGVATPEVAEGEEAPEIVISNESLTAAMALGGDNVPYTIEGTYDVEFTFGEEGAATIVFTLTDNSGVEGVAVADDAEVVYYNLQGVRVENPVNGVFVKVVNNKASKVLAK